MIGWNLVNINLIEDGYTANQFLTELSGQSINADILSRWDFGMYKNLIKEDEIIYGDDFALFDTAGYFVRVKNK